MGIACGRLRAVPLTHGVGDHQRGCDGRGKRRVRGRGPVEAAQSGSAFATAIAHLGNTASFFQTVLNKCVGGAQPPTTTTKIDDVVERDTSLRYHTHVF